MARRLIEMVLQEQDSLDIRELLKEHKLLEDLDGIRLYRGQTVKTRERNRGTYREAW
jgi:hypothetical protein